MRRCIPVGLCALLLPPTLRADDPPIKEWLSQRIIPEDQAMRDVQEFIEPGIPRMPELSTAEAWQATAKKLRADVLQKVVYRGKAREWRDAETEVEWLDTIPGGEGYSIRKVRYEALPGVWIPALLYEPDKLAEKVPVMLAVNGHDGKGKAADYKQIRCINLAKRGVRVLNAEWYGMGQLRSPGFTHYAMNQLDLCGTSGLAPFYLSMKRGIDVLLTLPKSDPERVAVSGLSGGGWQTIVISALDERVTLSNPVAGYSSFLTRNRHLKDLGDSEQTPSDLARYADYTHLTAMRAPRPTLLTFNSKDDCCFESGYALPPLVGAAEPVFKLFGKGDRLRTHVNDDPGTHNFERENREALYRMVGDFFFPDDDSFSATEIPCEKEVKSAEELNVPVPEANQTFNDLAKGLMEDLPRDSARPESAGQVAAWREGRLKQLGTLVPFRKVFERDRQETPVETDGFEVKRVLLRTKRGFSIPTVTISQENATGNTVVIHDSGKAEAAGVVAEALEEGHRVIAADLFYFGEAKVKERDHLFALLVAATGQRALGIQASQLAMLARIGGGCRVIAVGPRSSLIALVAAALEPEAITALELRETRGSLKELIEENVTVNQIPEAFCFGLLERFDVADLIAMVAPRPVVIRDPSERAKQEFAGLKDWYRVTGKQFDPLKN